jgi:hypothetical protein
VVTQWRRRTAMFDDHRKSFEIADERLSWDDEDPWAAPLDDSAPSPPLRRTISPRLRVIAAMAAVVAIVLALLDLGRTQHQPLPSPEARADVAGERAEVAGERAAVVVDATSAPARPRATRPSPPRSRRTASTRARRAAARRRSPPRARARPASRAPAAAAPPASPPTAQPAVAPPPAPSDEFGFER